MYFKDLLIKNFKKMKEFSKKEKGSFILVGFMDIIRKYF